MGTGSKFYVTHRRWYVACYFEDATTEREKIIADTNRLLADLRYSVPS